MVEGRFPSEGETMLRDVERAALMIESETCEDPDRLGDVYERLIAIDAYAAPSRAARILVGLGFDETMQGQPLDSFSGGWKMRVALASLLFTFGVFGIFLNRKNVIVILMCVELMLLAVNINLVAFSIYLNDIVGQVYDTARYGDSPIGRPIIGTAPASISTARNDLDEKAIVGRTGRRFVRRFLGNC